MQLKKFTPVLSLLLLISNTSSAGPVKSLCEEIGKKLTSVSVEECIKINFLADDTRTKQNKPILYKLFSPTSDQASKKVLLMGGIHGDEFSAISIIFKWMKLLDRQDDNSLNWIVVPLLNPDGLLHSEDSTRQNSNGIDLNRNFPTKDWGKIAPDYWQNISKMNPRRFPGLNANSEIETQWFIKQIEKSKPDVIIAVHAPHNLVDYNGPKSGPKKIGNLKQKPLKSYPGSLGSYAGLELAIPTITIELPYAGILPNEKEINDKWVDLNEWIKNN